MNNNLISSIYSDPISIICRELVKLSNNCEGTRYEGGLTSIESAPDKAGGMRVKVETQIKTCLSVSAEEKEHFIQQQGPLLLAGLMGPIPGDLDRVFVYLRHKLREPWQASQHGNITVRVIPYRDGQKFKVIFLEPRNESFLISPASIDFLPK